MKGKIIMNMYGVYLNFFFTNIHLQCMLMLTRHTIKPGMAPLAWPSLNVGLASNLSTKLALTKFLAWLQSWAPGLKFGL